MMAEPQMPFGLSGVPVVLTDDLVPWLESLLIDVDALDRAGRGAHPIFHMGAFQRGTGGGGGADQAFAVSKHQLCIRADIDQQPVLILLMRLLGQDHGAGIRTHEGGNGRQDMDVPG